MRRAAVSLSLTVLAMLFATAPALAGGDHTYPQVGPINEYFDPGRLQWGTDRVGMTISVALHDEHAVCHAEIQESVDGSAFVKIFEGNLHLNGSLGFSVLRNVDHEYQLEARATDCSGNATDFKLFPRFRLDGVQEDAFTFDGNWTTGSPKGAWGGTTADTTVKGAVATYTATGRDFTLVQTGGASFSGFAVYEDGTFIGGSTVHATQVHRENRVMMPYAFGWRETKDNETHTYSFVARCGRNHPRASLDGMLVWSEIVT